VKLVPCLLALVGAGLLAACGGGGDSGGGGSTAGASTAGAPPTVSKAQFVAQVDSDCRKLDAVLSTIPNSASSAAYIPDAYEGALTSMQSHGFPRDQTGLHQFFKAGSDLVGAYESADPAVHSGNQPVITKKSTVASAKARFAQAARNYGFKACG
jgi:hypothetical protein